MMICDGLDGREVGFRVLVGGNFFPFHVVQARSESHPMGTWGKAA
jgi:hypothetical protein